MPTHFRPAHHSIPPKSVIVFRGYKNGKLAWNGLNICMKAKLIFTCSKSTIRKAWSMFKVNNENTRATLSTLNTFHTFSSVSIDGFEQVNANWGDVYKKRQTFKKVRIPFKNIVTHSLWYRKTIFKNTSSIAGKSIKHMLLHHRWITFLFPRISFYGEFCSRFQKK